MAKTSNRKHARNYILENTKSLYDRLGPFNFANILHNLYTQFDSAEMILEITRLGEVHKISEAQLNQSKLY